jgi:hypothetical protein
MVELSCLLSLYHCDNYIDYNIYPMVRFEFKFIKYEKFIRIKYGDENKSIIIRIENLKNNQLLFQYYIASLLCCVNYKEINKDNNYDLFSAISTVDYWVIHHINLKYKKKDFNQIFYSQEPKRETSIKKQKKFLKMLNNDLKIGILEYPLIIIKNLTELYIEFIKELEYQIIDYENKIYLLSCIRGFNRDIYSTFKEVFDNDNDKIILPFIISYIKN